MLVKDLKIGEDVTAFYLIKAKNVKTSSANKPYIDFTFQDISGEVNGKLWDVKGDIENIYNPGEVVKVHASVTQWQSSVQLKVIKIRTVQESDQVDYSQFIPVAPIDPEVMYNEILSFVHRMDSEDIKKLVLALLEEYKPKWMYYPAAKSNHHAIKSGLLYHVLRMLRSGDVLCDIYKNLNRDLVFAGVILHDIEKMNEMDANEVGVVGEYTMEGQLLGHIIMGIKKIDQKCVELQVDREISLLIQHMILSHHYEAEYGSPKKPLIPEGELLHYLDMIDARMYDMNKALRDLEEGQFTDPIFVLDRRRLYKSSLSQSDL
ncbi:3'-5' exoribonuclease YhaM family protein [Fusibacter ferrireducens]|uniref:HD domain-containing protein n=1 Tax=Fusibacter ferrireducens TaxID=2785058 RepID=A0ABR9ZUJ4_9FIRM|nr:HD domain-containing protein [Fusibacter ferrireducens]MBF4694127.1 HD domain-containing protein [Fusibacter ferrireducens]